MVFQTFIDNLTVFILLEGSTTQVNFTENKNFTRSFQLNRRLDLTFKSKSWCVKLLITVSALLVRPIEIVNKLDTNFALNLPHYIRNCRVVRIRHVNEAFPISKFYSMAKLGLRLKIQITWTHEMLIEFVAKLRQQPASHQPQTIIYST